MLEGVTDEELEERKGLRVINVKGGARIEGIRPA